MIDFVKSTYVIKQLERLLLFKNIGLRSHICMNIHVDTIIAGIHQDIHDKKTLILFSSVIRDICKIKKKFVVEKDI